MIGNGPFAQLHKVVFHHGFNKSIRNKQMPLKKDTRTWSVRSMGRGRWQKRHERGRKLNKGRMKEEILDRI